MTTIAIAGPDGTTHIYAADDAATVSLGLLIASRARCEADIYAVASITKQINLIDGAYGPDALAAFRAHRDACRAEQNAYESAVMAVMADDLTDAEKVTALAALVY